MKNLDHIGFRDNKVRRESTSTGSIAGSAGPVASRGDQVGVRERYRVRVCFSRAVRHVGCRTIVHARRAVHHFKSSIAHFSTATIPRSFSESGKETHASLLDRREWRSPLFGSLHLCYRVNVGLVHKNLLSLCSSSCLFLRGKLMFLKSVGYCLCCYFFLTFA